MVAPNGRPRVYPLSVAYSAVEVLKSHLAWSPNIAVLLETRLTSVVSAAVTPNKTLRCTCILRVKTNGYYVTCARSPVLSYKPTRVKRARSRRVLRKTKLPRLAPNGVDIAPLTTVGYKTVVWTVNDWYT